MQQAATELADDGTAMPSSALMPLQIRPLASEKEVQLLKLLPDSDHPSKHRDRWELQQRGQATYLIAWLQGQPAGNLLVCRNEFLQEVGTIPNQCCWLEDLYVLPAFRNLGIGSRLVGAAESVARAAGDRWLALGVGLTPEYEAARKLYRKQGFRSAGHAIGYIGWWVTDAAGNKVWWEEAAEYLLKPLEP